MSTPITRKITDYEEYPGHTEAVNTITVRARVTGYLDKAYFKEQELLKKGFEVTEGDALFEIDPRTYQAEYNRTVANLALAQAHLDRLEADYRRAEKLIQTKAISQQEFDQVAGDRAEAEAAVKVADAARANAKLNLDFTIVKAPISGRISRRLVDPGNLIKADDTPLTTIVSLDPIYAYFDVDERTMMKIRELIRSGKIKSAVEKQVKVSLGLPDEKGFSRKGVIDFIDNQVESTSGTLKLRGVFANHDRMLSPGMFVRLQVPIGEAHQAILVSERALGSNQGQKFVYVVDGDNKVAERKIEAKPLNDEEGLCVITGGTVSAGERVVVDGLQRIHAGVTVAPKVIPMTGKEPPATAGKEEKKPKEERPVVKN